MRLSLLANAREMLCLTMVDIHSELGLVNVCDWDMGHGTFVTMVTRRRSNKEERVAFAIVVGTGHGTFVTCQIAPTGTLLIRDYV